MRTQTRTITVSNPSLNTSNALEMAHPNTLKCPCTTIPNRNFVTLSPIFHQVCSSDFVSAGWISLLMSIIYQSTSIDWRNQAGPQFQLLADLCHLAERTAEDAFERFLGQMFISSNVLMKSEFERQLNSTLEQFFQSTMIHFGQLVDIVDLRMQVDQPLVQLGSLADASLSNSFVVTIKDKTNGEESIQVKLKTLFLQFGRKFSWNIPFLVHVIWTQPQSIVFVSFIVIVIVWLGSTMMRVFTLIIHYPDWSQVVFSLILSTLHCFYSHSNCLSIVNSYIRETFYYFTDDPQWFDVQPLVYDPRSTRFSPNASIESIVKEMIIETWNSSISYDRYYQSSAPFYSAYSHRIRVQRVALKWFSHWFRWWVVSVLHWVSSHRTLSNLFSILSHRYANAKNKERTVS